MRKIHLKNSFSMAPHGDMLHTITFLSFSWLGFGWEAEVEVWNGMDEITSKITSLQNNLQLQLHCWIDCPPYKQNSFPLEIGQCQAQKVKESRSLGPPRPSGPCRPVLFTLQGNDHISYSWKMENNHQIIIENQIQQLKMSIFKTWAWLFQECHSGYQMCSDRFGEFPLLWATLDGYSSDVEDSFFEENVPSWKRSQITPGGNLFPSNLWRRYVGLLVHGSNRHGSIWWWAIW